ncbi:uncharacterized protein LOC120707038 isoform X2 [Panicum virgatum]|uniref:uncharacterized protein LOC120707038 isoform X2 n=1 Tax=Panicum virgatum TaxID=38727 RepID=UPI0019D64B9B|nr:uncharacterized protein LOC120707038 isoform X2 [Panicum virgatum]
MKPYSARAADERGPPSLAPPWDGGPSPPTLRGGGGGGVFTHTASSGFQYMCICTILNTFNVQMFKEMREIQSSSGSCDDRQKVKSSLLFPADTSELFLLSPGSPHHEGIYVLEGSWASYYCGCILCMTNDDQGLFICQWVLSIVPGGWHFDGQKCWIGSGTHGLGRSKNWCSSLRENTLPV